jgi:3-carboxy-cis,cis-muconate cycloisomerase
MTAGAATRLDQSLARIGVHADVMRRNLDASGGLVLSERVSSALTERLGKFRAQQVVATAARHPRGFRDALLADPNAGLAKDELDNLLDPLGYLGHARDQVDDYLKGRQE